MKKLEKFTSSTGLKNKRRVFLKYIKFGVPTILIVAIIVGLIGIYVKDSFELKARLTSKTDLWEGYLMSDVENNIFNIHLQYNLDFDNMMYECDDYANIDNWSSLVDIKLFSKCHHLIYSELGSKYNASYESYTFKINNSIDYAVFLYDLVFNNKSEYSFDYLNNDPLSKILYKFFGAGFWIKKGKIIIEKRDLLYSENLSLTSSSSHFIHKTSRTNDGHKLTYSDNFPISEFSTKIGKDLKTSEKILKMLNAYTTYSIPPDIKDYGEDKVSLNDTPIFNSRNNTTVRIPVKGINNIVKTGNSLYWNGSNWVRPNSGKIDPEFLLLDTGKIVSNKHNGNSPIKIKIKGIKKHPGDVSAIGTNTFLNKKFLDQGVPSGNSLEDIEVNYLDDDKFEIYATLDAKHGPNYIFVTNKYKKTETYQPVGAIISDKIGPYVAMDYSVYGQPDLYDYVDGEAKIEVQKWTGYYIPVYVDLKGDITELYIDGRRFNFDPKKNPQRLFRRIYVDSYIGYNRVKVVAYDSRGNRKEAFWTYEAVEAD